MFSATTNHSLAAAVTANHSLAAAVTANHSSTGNVTTNHSSGSVTLQDVNGAGRAAVGHAGPDAADRNVVHIYPVQSSGGDMEQESAGPRSTAVSGGGEGCTTLVYTTDNTPINYSRLKLKTMKRKCVFYVHLSGALSFIRIFFKVVPFI